MEYINLTTECLAEIEICEAISRHKKEKGEILISCLETQIKKFEELRNQFLESNIDESTKSELVRLINVNINSSLATIDEIKRRMEGTR